MASSKKKEDQKVNTTDRGIVKVAATMVSSPQIRRRKGISSVPMTRKNGARFTAPQDTIWKSAKPL
jgi:hypothetical protein